MGDESESDAESTEQSDDRDESPDHSPESDDTSTPSTDESSSAADDPVEPDDAEATSDGSAGDDVSDRSEGADDETEPPLQPEADGDASLAADEDEAAEPLSEQPAADGRDRDADVGDEGASDAVEDETADGDTPEDDAVDPDEIFADDPDVTVADDGSLELDDPTDEVDTSMEAHEAELGDSEEGFGEPLVEETDEPADEPTFDVDDEDEFDDGFDDLDDGLVDGPDSDQEMPLADHIEEMVRRLAVVFIISGTVALSVFGLGEVVDFVPSTIDIINFLWNQQIPGAGDPANTELRPHVYGPLELILTKLKVASLVGVVVGLPVFVYESYLFMRPGLYTKERKYYLASVPTSLILALVGVAFAHFVVLPAIFSYFTSYTTKAAVIAFGLAETFNLILILMGYMAIVFQIPLFIMLAIMMNLVTRVWLEDKRLIFWGSFLGLAFLVSPDPTGMAPIIIAITMVTLFEGTLALLRWTGN